MRNVSASMPAIPKSMRLSAGLLLLALFFFFGLAACSDKETGASPEDGSKRVTKGIPGLESAVDDLPSTVDMLPMEFSVLWEPWSGDFEGLVERRVIRAVVPYGGYQFYYDGGQPRGAIYELLQRFELWINEQLERRHVRVYVVAIPVSRNELFPALEQGHADLVAGDLTMTDERSAEFAFSRPLLRNIDEVVVTGPSAPALETIESLAGQEIYVRESSSYFEHLRDLGRQFESRGLEAPIIRLIDELLEAEDILELLDIGTFGITVLDDYKADFWAELFPDVDVRHDLVVNEGGAIGWAVRKDSTQFKETVNQFLRKYGRGTLVGNDTFNRYLADAERVRCQHSEEPAESIREIADAFRRYGARYDFEWLMLAAQAYQESGLRQNQRSPAGAVGIMQIKPATALDPNVGIPDVSTIDNNIHAGARYMRFLADRYFSNADIDPLNQWLLSLAAYNAGPARVASLRREAAANGYDPQTWFDNVEIIAARRIGRETVTYVSNIFKYYVGYQIAAERRSLRAERYADLLTVCEQ
jgi:membrane-bound lytic murein transglycosylase MltF